MGLFRRQRAPLIDEQGIYEVLHEMLIKVCPLWVPSLVTFGGVATLPLPNMVVVLTLSNGRWVQVVCDPPDQRGNMKRKSVKEIDLTWAETGELIVSLAEDWSARYEKAIADFNKPGDDEAVAWFRERKEQLDRALTVPI